MHDAPADATHSSDIHVDGAGVDGDPQATGALAGFVFEVVPAPPGIPPWAHYCARDAFTRLMGWPPGTPEYEAFPQIVSGEDLERLVAHLGLVWLDAHDHTMPAPPSTPGIVWTLIWAVQSAHVEFVGDCASFRLPPGRHLFGYVVKPDPPSTSTAEPETSPAAD